MKTPATTQGPRVNLGRGAVVHCFPSCESGELGVEPTAHPGFQHHLLE
jgi:hypothetical protein